MKPASLIGSSLPRVEGLAKLSGATHYIDDVSMPDMIYGTTVRSSCARAVIKGIHFPQGEIPWQEFTIVTAADIKAHNAVALITLDQPYLASEQINHPEEAVVLLAHPDKYLLEKARQSVKIEVEPLVPVFTIADAEKNTVTIHGTDNIFKEYEIKKGDVDEVWEKAAHVFERTYETGAQEQLYIENNGVIAIANASDGVTVWGSLQCPYYVHKALQHLFDLPPEKIRVIQVETGGGFGGKEEYPSMLAGHAALLALKAGKPVKMIYDRAEDLAATTKRHPSRTKHRTAVDANGKLLALDIDFAIDGGAYATLSSVVLSRGTIHAAGPYACDHVRIRSRAVATNCPPHGAFRGFGAPQSIFAMERHLDHIASKLGIEPEELRRRNFLKDGMTTATTQTVRDGVDMSALLDRALKVSDFKNKRAQFTKTNRDSKTIKRGIGLASFFHGAGFTGSGERMLASVVEVEATAQGKIRVLASSTEIGQGTNTIFSQIAAETLGVSPQVIEVAQPDTRFVPNSGPTVASRTCMIVGKLIEKACEHLLEQMQASEFSHSGKTDADFQRNCRAYLEKHGKLRGRAQYQQPPNVYWDDKLYRGEAYATYAWAVYIAEISFDTMTYAVSVDDFFAVQEIGKVVHPVMAAGQIEGGVVQGIGYALYEKVVWKDGRMANNRLTNYIIPTAQDVPYVKVFFEEQPAPYGPRGAKGIGELPLDGTAPAILNALAFATGTEFNHIPLLPEDIFHTLQRSKPQ